MSTYNEFKAKLAAMDTDELRRQRFLARHDLDDEELRAFARGSVLNEKVQWIMMIERELDDRHDNLEEQLLGETT